LTERRTHRGWSCLLAILIVAAVSCAILLLTFIFGTWLLTAMGKALIVNDPLERADMFFVLNGDVNTRPVQTVDLYRQGLAPVVGIAQTEKHSTEELGLLPNETDVAIQEMVKLGIPQDSIVVIPSEEPVTSTYDEALALRQYIENNDIHSIIIVTSEFHTRRAKWICEKELKGLDVTIMMAATPNEDFNSSNWWKSENGLITVNNEYVKLLYYFWKYR
jgi:uncharacterized SAM-binding protein YcdF (DUF218 family)